MIRWLLRKFNPAGLYDYTLAAYNKAVEDLKLCLDAAQEKQNSIGDEIDRLQNEALEVTARMNQIEKLRSKLRVI